MQERRLEAFRRENVWRTHWSSAFGSCYLMRQLNQKYTSKNIYAAWGNTKYADQKYDAGTWTAPNKNQAGSRGRSSPVGLGCGSRPPPSPGPAAFPGFTWPRSKKGYGSGLGLGLGLGKISRKQRMLGTPCSSISRIANKRKKLDFQYFQDRGHKKNQMSDNSRSSENIKNYISRICRLPENAADFAGQCNNQICR